MESRRQAKVGKLIQRELAVVLQKLGPQRLGINFITVTHVKPSPDLSMAKVYLSFINAKNPEDFVKRIRDNNSVIKAELAKRLRHDLRKLPELRYFYDDTLDYSERMDELFDELRKKEGGEE